MGSIVPSRIIRELSRSASSFPARGSRGCPCGCTVRGVNSSRKSPKGATTAGLFDREIYLDIETIRLSHEVDGGWGNVRAFGLAVAVTWDKDSGFRHWFEDDALKPISDLDNFTRVITFNGNRFDFEVLRGYAPVATARERSFDVLEYLHKQLGHRVKLDQLAKDTLALLKAAMASKP